MAASTPYSVRFAGPTLIPQNKAHTVQVEIEHNGSAPTVTAAAFSLFDTSGSAIISSATATEAGGTLSYEVPAVDTADQTMGIGYMVRFEVTIASYEHYFSNNAAIVLQQLYPPIGTTDLTNRYTKLAALMVSGTSAELQKYIDNAWSDLLIRMYSGGLRFWTIRSPGHLRDWVTTRSLAYALADLALVVASGSGYRDESRRLERMLPAQYEQIRSLLDVSEDNNASSIQTPTAGVIQLSTGRGLYGGT